MKTNDVLIIGGGAAGLAAANFALSAGARVTLLESNEKFGKKLYITGKGRCNLTNDCDVERFLQKVPRNPRFLYPALRFLSPEALRALMRSLGCDTVVERGGRVFPASGHASDVTAAWLRGLRGGADCRLRTRALSLCVQEGRLCGVRVRDASGEHTLPCDAAIIATGGVSYPLTGSTGDGYRLAQSAGHTLTEPLPALVPLCCRDEWPKSLQGLSLKNVALSARAPGQKPFCEQGELLFTHFGVSGPLALTLSSRFAGCDWPRSEVWLDLKPALTDEQVDARLRREFAAAPRRLLKSLLPALAPARLASLLPALGGLNGEKQAAQITSGERARLTQTLKRLPLPLLGTRGMDEAVVTCGGVSTREVSPSTLESKKLPGLYFAGEVLDIDALTGGFNLHIAFATGALAGDSAARRQCMESEG